jgi:hypothetical protein
VSLSNTVWFPLYTAAVLVKLENVRMEPVPNEPTKGPLATWNSPAKSFAKSQVETKLNEYCGTRIPVAVNVVVPLLKDILTWPATVQVISNR